MPWLPNIPQAPDRLSASQPQILGDFQALEAWSIVNHSSPAAAPATLGQHTFLTLFPQALAPAGNLITANNVNLYVDNVNEPQVKRGANVPVPWLNKNLVVFDGWSYLPSGLVIKWRTIQNGVGGAVNIDLNTFGPIFVNPSGVFAIWFTLNSIGGADVDPNKFISVVNKINPNAVRVFFSDRTAVGPTATATPYTWIAIGMV